MKYFCCCFADERFYLSFDMRSDLELVQSLVELFRLGRTWGQTLFGEKMSGAFHDRGEIFLGALLETRHIEETVLAALKRYQLANVTSFSHQAIEAFDVFKGNCFVGRAVHDKGGRQA